MQTTPVDPRDIGYEVDPLAYRVYFHDADGAADEWRLTETASVNECIAWAERHAGNRTYVLYVELPKSGSERFLVPLDGHDPNAQ